MLHLVPEVVALAAALADAGKDGIAAVLHGDVVNQFLNQHRLADARTAEQADLAALGIRLEQVDDLDARFEDVDGRLLLGERRRLAVDLPALGVVRHGRASVDRRAEGVEHPPERPLADRHADAAAGGDRLHAAGEVFALREHDAAHGVSADLLRDFHHDAAAVDVDRQRLADARQRARLKLDVDDRAGDGDNLSCVQDSFPLALRSRWARAPAATSVISCVIAA